MRTVRNVYVDTVSGGLTFPFPCGKLVKSLGGAYKMIDNNEILSDIEWLMAELEKGRRSGEENGYLSEEEVSKRLKARSEAIKARLLSDDNSLKKE